METTDEEMYFNTVSQVAYEGASTSYRANLNSLLNGDADTLAARELLLLQMRSAHAIRNNGYAKAGLQKYMTSLGAIKVKWKDKEGKIHLPMQESWDEFAADPNLDGYGNLGNTQSVWNSSSFQDGNAYTRMVTKRSGNKNKVPLKLQTIPAQLHDVLYNGISTKDNIKYGIKFKDSKPVKYYFRQGIYDSVWGGIENLNKHTVIDAEDILHQFVRESPGQWIGIPIPASVLISLYEIDELVDATVAKQKAAQAIAWIIENTNPMSMTPTGAPLVVKDKEANDKIVFKATGGNTQYLNKGEKINFYQSTDIGPNLPTLIKSELMRIAAGFGIPYHSLTGDTSSLDFSSLRAIAVEFRQRLEYIHYFYTIPLSLAPLTARFKELASLYVEDSANATPSYNLPIWRGVDDLKDAQSDLLEVQSGFSTLEKKLDERDTTFEEVKADRERIRELNLTTLLQEPNTNTNQSTNIEANTNSTSL